MKRHLDTLISGLLFIVIGTAFLLDALDVWTIRIERLWPVALVAVGLAILLGGRKASPEPPSDDAGPAPQPTEEPD